MGSDGHEWVRKEKENQFLDHHVQGAITFEGRNLMMWGCMMPQGVGFSCKIDGRMDIKLYTNIIQIELLQTLEFYRLERDNIIFQHDSDLKHTSRIARKWFKHNRIEYLNELDNQ